MAFKVNPDIICGISLSFLASLLVRICHRNASCTNLPAALELTIKVLQLFLVSPCLFLSLLFHRRTQAEMAHTCRGTINLATAHIDTEDACNIVLSSGGRTYHLKASTEVERQRWVTALELAKAKAIRMMNDQSGKGQLLTWNIQGSYGHGKPGKVMEFSKWSFPGLVKSWKKLKS